MGGASRGQGRHDLRGIGQSSAGDTDSSSNMTTHRVANLSPGDLHDVSVAKRAGASPLAPTRGGEEVDKQLVDAFTLVVMHPVRRVGQALDAVEVGYVIVVGLG